MSKGTVLVTGGTGYIGSFTTLTLLESGYDVIVLDNLANSSVEALSRIETICGRRPAFHLVDVTDEAAVAAVFAQYALPDGTSNKISSVIHFAALKSVGESTETPLEYYRVNVGGTIALLRAMQNANVRTIVFSSSATVYGDATRFDGMIPIPEECPLGPTNPYGRTKFVIEMVIGDHVAANEGWSAALLRYFNPAGAHPSGIMGEDPQGVPYNLLPLLGQVAVGRREKLQVFGTDYASHDGTAIRDYIHVLDLAAGHVSALAHLQAHPALGCRAWNLGTGKGSTVFDIIKAFSKAVGRDLPYEVCARRPGDVLDLTAVPARAHKELNWRATRSLEDACRDLWRWVEASPYGYREQAKEELVREAVARRERGEKW